MPNPRRPGSGATAGRSGFSLIEMIGVLAIIAIVAAVVLPNLARRISRTTGEKEDSALVVLAEGLQRHVRTYQSIPGQASWSTNLSGMTGLALNTVKYVNPSDPASARVYLIHPNFTPATGSGGGFADPMWTQTGFGAASVSNAKILIVSTHKSSLALPVSSGKASSAAVFDAIWDWTYNPTTGSPPSGWSAPWTGNGEYLHVQRVNLAGQFQRITFSNAHYPGVYPSAQFGSAGASNLSSAAAMDAFYLSGTYLRLYKDSGAGGALDLSHSVETWMNFLYESNRWRIP